MVCRTTGEHNLENQNLNTDSSWVGTKYLVQWWNEDRTGRQSGRLPSYS